MFVALLYLATLSFVPIFVGYFSFFFIKKEKLINDFKLDVNVFIILLIVLFTTFNKLLNIDKVETIKDLVPETILMILMYWISKSFDSKAIKVFILFTVFETFIVFLEYSLNINSFFPSLYQEYIESDLLYYRRPYGLSANTSVVALKIFLCLLVFVRYKVFSRNSRIIIFVVLMAGIILTFNRTAMVSILIFFILWFIKTVDLSKKSIPLLLFALALFVLLLPNFQTITYQITRGREGLDIISSRMVIWEDFYNFIKENTLFGNNSYKYFTEFNGRRAHGHSSYLQIIATHGILISLLFFVLIFRNLNKSNYIFVVPILFFSLTQYGIFWGFSITDIMIYVFLFNRIENEALPKEDI
jgi:hypothetical protein